MFWYGQSLSKQEKKDANTNRQGGLTTVPVFLEAMDHPSAHILGLITSIYDIGALAGTIIVAIFGMKLGRRWAIVIGCASVIVGGSLQASAYGVGQMLAGRVIAVSELNDFIPSKFKI